MTYICGTGILPTYLPKQPSPFLSYSERNLKDVASPLKGIITFPEETNPKSKARVYSVGSTNRWRLAVTLSGDLLGSSQATKSNITRKNKTLIKNMTDNGRHSETDSVICPHFQARPFTSPAELSPRGRNLSTSRPITLPSLQSSEPFISYAHASRSKWKDPTQILEMFARITSQEKEPDVSLYCMDQLWRLHSAYMIKSEVLSSLLANSFKCQPSVYNTRTCEDVDMYISQSDAYTSQYKDVSRRLNIKDVDDYRGLENRKSGSSRIHVRLRIDDAWITKNAMAMALGHLYLDECIVAPGDVIETLAAAHALKFNNLISSCCEVLISNLSSETVCLFLQAAKKYEQASVVSACERWLELNLVSQLAYTMYIKDLSSETLSKILKSSKLFTFTEFSLYKALCFWLFMQLHHDMQFMPSQTSIMNYFSSMTRTCSFLEREEGIPYSTVFGCLRLHGITELKHLQDIMYMNVIPQSWLLRVFSHHYQALHGGGDMSFLLNFSLGAGRFGFILEQVPGYHSEIVSMHGFHFELKAQKHGTADKYIVYMQRLRPTDPSLSFRSCERATFSMRSDRLVRYQITAQHKSHTDHSQWCCKTSGMVEQAFGMDLKNARSQILRLCEVHPPIYVSFAIFFPPS